MEFPDKILSFLNDVSSIDIGYGGFTFFQPENLDKAQVGYSIDARKNSIVLNGTEGEWKKEWIVIGLDDLVGDPIIVDTLTSSLVVMTAEPSEEWNPYPISDSRENFATIISELAVLSVNRSTPQDFDKNPISEQEKTALLTTIAAANPNSELEYWEGFLDLE